MATNMEMSKAVPSLISEIETTSEFIDRYSGYIPKWIDIIENDIVHSSSEDASRVRSLRSLLSQNKEIRTLLAEKTSMQVLREIAVKLDEYTLSILNHINSIPGFFVTFTKAGAPSPPRDQQAPLDIYVNTRAAKHTIRDFRASGWSWVLHNNLNSLLHDLGLSKTDGARALLLDARCRTREAESAAIWMFDFFRLLRNSDGVAHSQEKHDRVFDDKDDSRVREIFKTKALACQNGSKVSSGSLLDNAIRFFHLCRS
ncbi:hypothetical protein BS50DRAFT_581559 [Corynespora cassiicola Philippines]|uniref:Uncharacterized protein n=1 Tax=Corynespora cassiicola Philippines TaxID=1448308 RepID=A0A2T2PAV0_CORCC|nr:hypothetical protein BS50DRAFT_581559 [Corynespora cassiicola Philippines]